MNVQENNVNILTGNGQVQSQSERAQLGRSQVQSGSGQVQCGSEKAQI